ncbi:mitochondrial zinc maintenance protein 1, mitochondrial [Trichophyton rubrum D6]|uniref:Mitochondrial zinc maintenance protein 1, mitochondrial n=4 Tax=Trichophyton TaxID=5550 RepID=A0A178EYH0_TRIRU|nr:mitochondrial zinc maintenance protein 1, mitochondrial [Trichophyton rubrum CBS 118892]EZF24693.1 mitochondrial zinc maintenance protein 1, mitochondrial [Trichophyton rubrum MR850]EZF43760.1 mitochondrial zinc maintenance protein 1, mitochondrial [Trichophyton rubrum CBS 100081]EZF54353.1 mitochondrial zinc maintenance protein 1, mitochondrial [Trichophyton rubrum CBS 288.86]EZF65044.1 mitochondrial zinc maintenance protein 1, mitochondrial [Trichophyton rubrum CBS 289.86]EZF75621.1 mitoc
MAAATSPVSALSAYRQLLRATRIAFNGDYPVLHAARAEARKQFEQNRQLGVDTPLKIQHALETAHILKTNIVQGTKIETKDEGGEKVDRYSLRIHEYTERGDNDTIKAAGEKPVKVGKGCCSS